MLFRPIGKTLGVELLQVAAAPISHHASITPVFSSRRRGATGVHHQAADRGPNIFTYEVDHGINIDTPSHVANEKH